jgi:hypothetical protein
MHYLSNDTHTSSWPIADEFELGPDAERPMERALWARLPTINSKDVGHRARRDYRYLYLEPSVFVSLILQQSETVCVVEERTYHLPHLLENENYSKIMKKNLVNLAGATRTFQLPLTPV